MKAFVIFFVLSFISTATWAIDAKVTYKLDYKQPLFTKMTCEGRSCACSEDTELDQDNMKCRKCPEGLTYDTSRRACYDASQTREEILKLESVFTAESAAALHAWDVADPDTCDFKSLVNGKFGSCKCALEVLAFTVGTGPKIRVNINRTFNSESQKCERKEAYQLTVMDVGCIGPNDGAFDILKLLGLVEIKYKGENSSLASCGYDEGTHLMTVTNEAMLSSIIDTVAFILKPNDFVKGKKIESYEIIESSLNY